MKPQSHTSLPVAHRKLRWLHFDDQEYLTELTGLDDLLRDEGPLASRLRHELCMPNDTRSPDPH